jgi:hypothetical protein
VQKSTSEVGWRTGLDRTRWLRSAGFEKLLHALVGDAEQLRSISTAEPPLGERSGCFDHFALRFGAGTLGLGPGPGDAVSDSDQVDAPRLDSARIGARGGSRTRTSLARRGV